MATYIERAALLAAYDAAHEGAPGRARKLIEDAHAVDVAPVVRARWVASGQCNHKPCRIRNTDKWTIYKCSVCGHSNGRRFNSNYCPNCGARMDGE